LTHAAAFRPAMRPKTAPDVISPAAQGPEIGWPVVSSTSVSFVILRPPKVNAKDDAGRHGVGIVGRLTRERFLALRKAMRRERIADAQPVAERHPILHVFGPERVAIGV